MDRILIIEDDRQVREILKFYLSQEKRFALDFARNAEQGLELIKREPFDLILLDIMLPGLDGISLCEALRRYTFCPVIFISCLNDDDTIIRAMNMGGDDYIPKPFHAPVLLARIEACLRRSRMAFSEQQSIRVGDLTLDPNVRTLAKRGEPVILSPTEYAVLLYLMSNRGKFISFEEVYRAIWQKPSLGDMRTLFVHIRNLRKKLEDDPSSPHYIVTQHRNGYVFAAE